MEIIAFKDWLLEPNTSSTSKVYENVSLSGAESCNCNNCKNYIANRETVFPIEVKDLFLKLGIDYKKEVEITNWETLPNGLHFIGGWFNFKGKILSGKLCDIPLPSGGFTLELTKINENFSIGFSNIITTTFFEDKKDLIQIEFETNIPWLIDKNLES